MKYSPAYFDNYYSGSYEDTYHFAFPLDRILKKEWSACYKEMPTSFADIGCGLGHTLLEARNLLPKAEVIYGVEYQEIPADRAVSKDIVFGDVMEIYLQLPVVDLLYVACSMYIPWNQQSEFLTAMAGLARKAIVFANVYIEDGRSIPKDHLRTSIYKSRQAFKNVMKSLNFEFKGSKNIDFFINT